jgi:hypothetical protein
VEPIVIPSPSGRSDAESRHRYGVYGIDIVSDRPLAMPAYSHDPLGRVECVRGAAAVFDAARQTTALERAPDAWHQYAALGDGSTYVRWQGVGEFLVAANGRRITSRPAADGSRESFQVYMLGQALSFALVKQRFEPLHATAIVVDGHAIAFLGGSAFGKSTLAACFLAGGHRLLTDDLLILRSCAEGIVAYPGPPRIKLFPQIARTFLSGAASGVAMNAGTEKRILALDETQACARPVRLAAIFSLAVPRESCRSNRPTIEPMSPREAFVELVGSSFNRRLAGAQRMARQFAAMAPIADAVPFKKLTYPRRIDLLTDVRAMVLADAHVASACGRTIRG